MSPLTRKALRRLDAAHPSSGLRPQTEAEWRKLQVAHIALSEAMHRDLGASEAEAKRLAHLIMGGPAGRVLIGFGLDQAEREDQP
jgi:hypothetical protein